jgi:uncharacterized protein YndB with AHSA1/START domain
MTKIYHYLNINAPVSKVYEAVSSIDYLKKWWTTDASGNSALGGIIRFGFGKNYDLMKVIADEKNKFVAWEVMEANFPQGNEWRPTIISFDLSEDENKNTIVRFIHDGWKEATDFYGICNYHWGIFMVSLKSLCETGKGNPQED